MIMTQRRNIRLITAVTLAFAAMASSAPTGAAASSYPDRMIRIVVPFSAGSMTDILARVLSEKLGQMWRQSVIVENRSGIAGAASVANSAPDGYTIMLTSNGHTVIGKVNSNLTFDPVGDFVGISKIASMPLTLVVPPDSPAKSLADLIVRAKASPGKMSYASAGLASTSYIASELLKQTANIDLFHVPYRGLADAINSVMRGDTTMLFTPSANGLDLIEAGKVRALAVSAPTRFPGLPAVPTFAEAGLPEFVYDAWFGMLAPAGTQREILEKISRDIHTVLNSPEIKDLLSRQGIVPVTSSPEDFTSLLKNDTARFSRLLPSLQN